MTKNNISEYSCINNNSNSNISNKIFNDNEALFFI